MAFRSFVMVKVVAEPEEVEVGGGFLFFSDDFCNNFDLTGFVDFENDGEGEGGGGRGWGEVVSVRKGGT